MAPGPSCDFADIADDIVDVREYLSCLGTLSRPEIKPSSTLPVLALSTGSASRAPVGGVGSYVDGLCSATGESFTVEDFGKGLRRDIVSP